MHVPSPLHLPTLSNSSNATLNQNHNILASQ